MKLFNLPQNVAMLGKKRSHRLKPLQIDILEVLSPPC